MNSYHLTMALLVLALLCTSCDKVTLADAVEVASPLLVAAFNKTQADSEVQAAWLSGDWDRVQDVGIPKFRRYVKNELVTLALQGKPERKIWEFINENGDRFDAALYRESDDGADGVWVRLSLFMEGGSDEPETLDGNDTRVTAALQPSPELLKLVEVVAYEEWKAVEHEQEHGRR